MLQCKPLSPPSKLTESGHCQTSLAFPYVAAAAAEVAAAGKVDAEYFAAETTAAVRSVNMSEGNL